MPFCDRRHEVSSDVAVGDGKAVRPAQKRQEGAEHPFRFPADLGIRKEFHRSRKSRGSDFEGRQPPGSVLREAGLAPWQSGRGVGPWRISARAERNASSVNFPLNRRVMTAAVRVRAAFVETFGSSSPPPTRHGRRGKYDCQFGLDAEFECGRHFQSSCEGKLK